MGESHPFFTYITHNAPNTLKVHIQALHERTIHAKLTGTRCEAMEDSTNGSSFDYTKCILVRNAIEFSGLNNVVLWDQSSGHKSEYTFAYGKQPNLWNSCEVGLQPQKHINSSGKVSSEFLFSSDGILAISTQPIWRTFSVLGAEKE